MSIASIPPQPFASSENLIARRSFRPLLRLLGIAKHFFTNNPFGGLIQIVVECPRDLQILRPQSLIDEGLGYAQDNRRMPLARIAVGPEPITAAKRSEETTAPEGREGEGENG